MSSVNDYMLPCLNKKLFGFDCMGCGLQRSVSLLLQADFIGAFYMYPAVYTLVLLFIVIVVNFFKNFKYAVTIIYILAIINALIMITNFSIKTFLT